MWRWIGKLIVEGVVLTVAGYFTLKAIENWPANIPWRETAIELATDPVAQIATAPAVLMTLLVALYIRKFGFGFDRITPIGKLVWFSAGVGTLLPLGIHSVLGNADAALDTFKGDSVSFGLILAVASWLMAKGAVRVLRDGEFDKLPKWPGDSG